MYNLIVLNSQGVPATTSLKIAETFRKRHYNVLRDIHKIECSESFRLLNFEESSYLNAQNKEQPMFLMTRDGFSFLAMGFTGPKAARWKEDFINAFKMMELRLKQKEQIQPKVDFYDKVSASKDSRTMGQVAKILDLGRNLLFELLRDNDVLMDSDSEWNTPYQEYIQQGYFKVVPSSTKGKNQTFVTPKGLFWLQKVVTEKFLALPESWVANSKKKGPTTDEMIGNLMKECFGEPIKNDTDEPDESDKPEFCSNCGQPKPDYSKMSIDQLSHHLNHMNGKIREVLGIKSQRAAVKRDVLKELDELEQLLYR